MAFVKKSINHRVIVHGSHVVVDMIEIQYLSSAILHLEVEKIFVPLSHTCHGFYPGRRVHRPFDLVLDDFK
jgi:hypothetical protein